MFHYTVCRIIIEEILGIRHDINVVENQGNVLVIIGIHVLNSDESDVFHGTAIEFTVIFLMNIEYFVGFVIDILENGLHMIGVKFVLFLAIPVSHDEYEGWCVRFGIIYAKCNVFRGVDVVYCRFDHVFYFI